MDNQNSPIEIHLTVNEIIQNVNLKLIDNDNLSFSLNKQKETINLTIQEGEGNINLEITDGKNGLSNYEIWLQHGNTGSIDDFFYFLKGDKGDPGEKTERTSELTNDGEDGVNKFITEETLENIDNWESTDW